MKNLLIKYRLLFLAVLIHTQINAQDTLNFEGIKQYSNYVTAAFKQKYPSLTFFKYRLITPQFNIYDYYKGNETDSVCNALSYLSLVNNLDISNYENDPKVNLPYIESVLFREVSNNITPLSLSLIEYSELKDSAIFLNAIDFANNRFIDKSPVGFYPFKKSILFASSALNQALNGDQVRFLFNDSLFLTNVDKQSVSSIMVDYGDGKGYVPLIKGTAQTIKYASLGAKTIKVKLLYKNKVYYSASNIMLLSLSGGVRSSVLPPDNVVNIVATDMNGLPIYGQYGVWLAPCNSTRRVRKPYILSAGFNPGNGKQLVSNGLNPKLNMLLNNIAINIPNTPFGWNGDWRGTFYETYNGVFSKDFSPGNTEGNSNGNRYLDRLRDEGYDIVICAYNNGTDYAQNNANLFKEVIKKINLEKAANGSNFENVVSGYSAGGIASRLALAQMEADYKIDPIRNPHPHTKIWVSIESENQGSNVPLGLQYLIDFQQNPFNIFPIIPPFMPPTDPIVTADLINHLAAVLAHKFSNNPTAYELTNFTSAYPGIMTPHRVALLNKLASIPGNTSNGYPEFCRRVGVGQGSSVGIPVPHDGPITFDSKLASLISNFQAPPLPATSCGNYTVRLPHAVKTTTARWWSSNNPSLPLFNGKVALDPNFTWFPKTCVKFFGQCYCMGEYNTSGPVITISQKTANRPNNPYFVNYDDVPSSTLSAHRRLYEDAAYKYYNYPFMGLNSNATSDTKLHAFASTVSTLDLHDPASTLPVPIFTSPVSLQLMYRKPGSGGSTPNQSYGYPYINHPGNHYNITPYDAVFAIGENPGSYPFIGGLKPNNQLHVEDPLPDIGDYLARVEVAPEDLFLSNRNLAASKVDYNAEFEARSHIVVGNGIYAALGNQNYLTPNGDFNVDKNSHAILHAGDSILFLPGSSVALGARLEAFIQAYPCENVLR